jgi:hypothetical protein
MPFARIRSPVEQIRVSTVGQIWILVRDTPTRLNETFSRGAVVVRRQWRSAGGLAGSPAAVLPRLLPIGTLPNDAVEEVSLRRVVCAALDRHAVGQVLANLSHRDLLKYERDGASAPALRTPARS